MIVWSGLLLPPSETFVQAQAGALRRFNPHFAGVRSAGAKSLLAPDDCILLNRGGPGGAMAEAMFKLAGMAPRLCRKLRSLRPALLHAHHGVSGALALPLVRALDVPMVVTFHGADATAKLLPAYASLAQWAIRRRAERFKRDTALFVAVSEFIRRKLIDRGYPSEKIVVHHIGVDTREFRPDPGVAREPVVLFVGRLAEKKGCEYLIRAMAHVQQSCPNLRLVIAGDGPLKGILHALAASTLREFTFLGLQSHDQVRDWMKRASILVAPSVTASNGDSEGLPMVIVEAQAMGLPVVASDHAGIGEAIADGETGLMAAERDVETLARHIVRLSSDESLRLAICANARRQAETSFDLNRQTGVLEGLYDRVLEQSPDARVARLIQLNH